MGIIANASLLKSLPGESEEFQHFRLFSGASPSHLDAHTYAALLTPRLPDFAFTAPIYDEIRTPKAYPRPMCVYWVESDSCLCYSQQMSRMDIEQSTCKNIVKYGYFDFALEPPSRSEKVGNRHF